jgi:hypothetical protein
MVNLVQTLYESGSNFKFYYMVVYTIYRDYIKIKAEFFSYSTLYYQFYLTKMLFSTLYIRKIKNIANLSYKKFKTK